MQNLTVIFFILLVAQICQAYVPNVDRLGRIFKSSRISLFDPDTITSVAADPAVNQGALDVAVSTFVTTFTSRITGVLIGNIVAGAALKIGTDFVRNKVDEFSDKKKEKVKELQKEQKQNDIPGEAWLKLLACIVIDFIGDSSFALPGIGELEDVAWAPLSSYALRTLFGSNAIAGLDFAKEILPGTDFIPVATLAWALVYILPGNPLAKALGLPAINSPKDGTKNSIVKK